MLLPDFNVTAAFGFIDPFRAANYLRGSGLYSWDFISLNSQPVVASNSARIETEVTLAEKKTYDMIVVNSSWAPERFETSELKKWLGNHLRNGATLAGIDTGAFVLAAAGLMHRSRATVHYEHCAAFKELYPACVLEEVLYVIDGDRLTCSGGAASTDLALRLVQIQHGLELANASAVYLFKGRHRAGNEPQVEHDREPVGYSMPAKLREAIVLMERNVEEPLSPAEIAATLSISQRQLQRLFKRSTGVTPVRYGINVRLNRARGLVTQTDMSVAEIASACGFGATEQFSRSYSAHFGVSPSLDRIEGRVPFQFRAYPTHISA